MIRNSDLLIKEYLMELCKKLERKIELNFGRKFHLNCEKNIDNFIQALKTNKSYDKLLIDNIHISKQTLNFTYIGFVLGIAHAYATDSGQQENLIKSPSDILNIKADSYLKKYQYEHFKKYFLNVMSNITNDSGYKNRSLGDIVIISKSIPDRYIVSLSQEMSRLNTKYLQKLNNTPVDITDDIIDDYSEIYDKGCKCLEKYVKISFKFVNDIKGNTGLKFKRVQKKDVYTLKEKLEQSDCNFKELFKPFSTIIWNSIKHGESIKDPSFKKVTFQSNDGNRIRSYGSFMRLVGELFCVLFVLSRFSSYLILTKIREMTV